MSTNWLESSGSGMFVYALKVAVNRGYIDSSYLTVAQKGWTGMMSKVTNSAGTMPSITGAVKGMGVQNNYAAYVATTMMPLLTDSPARAVRDPPRRRRDGSAVAWPRPGSRCWRSCRRLCGGACETGRRARRRAGVGTSRPGTSCSGATC